MSLSEATVNSGFDEHASLAPNNRYFLLKGSVLYTGRYVYDPNKPRFDDIRKLKAFPAIDYDLINDFIQKTRNQK